jgi:uncharacterized protein YcfL
MKKSLIVAFALCLLFLVGCGSLAGTGNTSSTQTSQKTVATTTVSQPPACSAVQAREAQLNKEIKAVNAQIAAAHGNQSIIRQAEQTLLRLHLLLVQEQKSLKTCKATR